MKFLNFVEFEALDSFAIHHDEVHICFNHLQNTPSNVEIFTLLFLEVLIALNHLLV
jgi:hypothetical protein